MLEPRFCPRAVILCASVYSPEAGHGNRLTPKVLGEGEVGYWEGLQGESKDPSQANRDQQVLGEKKAKMSE